MAPDSSPVRTILRLSTAGSVDDGKSTLIGRLLYDTDNVYDDHIQALKKSSKKLAGESLALLTDGLKAEREQGITIDVAYRYFSTEKRRFILADSPGHEQYTRNMATGASTAQVTIILVDAQKGIVSQTRRHSFIASLMGVPRLLIAVNKMDLVDFQEERFESVRTQFIEFATRLGIHELRFIPVSALQGDNIVHSSSRMPWYHGETVMEYLENVYVASDTNFVDFRFPVQYVIRPNAQYRGYAGQVASGIIRRGDEIVVLPSLKRSKVKSIDTFQNGKMCSLEEAFSPLSVTLTLEDEIDIARGDMLAKPLNIPAMRSQFEALLVWMNAEITHSGKTYLLRHASRTSKVFLDKVIYKIDVNTLGRNPGDNLDLNEIGRVSFTSTEPLYLDLYDRNRSTGNFILIDPETLHTVAAGMVIDRLPAESPSPPPKTSPSHLHEEQGMVTKALREEQNGHQALTLWCTGLSGSGKSTIAKSLEQRLFHKGHQIYRLDGDTIRRGLTSDLGFSAKDRRENIRRVAEVAKLFNEAGVTVICAFISPFREDRTLAKEIVGTENFREIYMDASVSVCESRDPHGLYAKARAGEIQEFTGITAPYEAPTTPSLSLDTHSLTVDECVQRILKDIILLEEK